MSKSKTMRVTFRILSGAGGLVQGMCQGELSKMLNEWKMIHGDCFILKSIGYLRLIEFNNEDDFNLFLQTFRPQSEHWWRNAKIEKS